MKRVLDLAAGLLACAPSTAPDPLYLDTTG
jgi:hypothetical protein